MKTLILDGSLTNDSQAVKLTNALRKHLPESETIVLREQRIGNCAGDFFCWVRSPGMCNTNDDNRLIAAKIVQSELLIYLTPVTFGGYSSELKLMVDHQIQNLSPFLPLSKARFITRNDTAGIPMSSRSAGCRNQIHGPRQSSVTLSIAIPSTCMPKHRFVDW